MIDVVSAEASHVAHIAAHIRDADRAEIMASAGLEPEEGIHSSMQWSSMMWTGRADGEPVCMFGVGGPYLLGGLGIPWLIGTTKLIQHRYEFLALNKVYVSRMLGVYSTLRNYVDARNDASIRWLKWIGFEIGSAEPYGVQNMPFHPFEMRRYHV